MTLAEFRRAYLTATFLPACREDLIALMSSPTVVTDLTGGHLALMVRLEDYVQLVTKFIKAQTGG